LFDLLSIKNKGANLMLEPSAGAFDEFHILCDFNVHNC